MFKKIERPQPQVPVNPQQEEGQDVLVVQVPTETQEFFQVDDKIMNLNSYLCWLGNELMEIKRGIVG